MDRNSHNVIVIEIILKTVKEKNAFIYMEIIKPCFYFLVCCIL